MLNTISEINETISIINNLKSNKISIYKSINLLNLTSRKYYYSITHKRKNLLQKQKKFLIMTERIKDIVLQTHFRYGIRKIKYLYFINYHQKISFELTRTIMKKNNLNCKLKKYYKKPKLNHKLIIQKNLINQNFKSFKPFQKLFSDITEFEINNKKIYYSVIIDSYNNQIVSSKISFRCNLKLIIKTLNKIKKSQSDLCYFHTDRGTIYKSSKFQKILIKRGFIPSMSNIANPKDNAVIENFFSITKGYLKKPSLYQLERFANFYNHNWILSKLNNQTPIGYLRTKNF